jgi:DNA-binding transcriptional regulator LsrR (DeoR family)
VSVGRKVRDKDLFNVEAAAFLRARHGLKQVEIAGILGGGSQSYVSRLLKRARDLGLLEEVYKFTGEDRLAPERLEALQRLVEPKGLVKALKEIDASTGVRVRRALVVDSGTGTSRRALELRLKRLGTAAAGRLGELLQRSEVFAVTWGATVSHVVDALAAAPPLLPPGRSIRFVPVCAEPTEQASNRDTSSHLVQRLHRIVRASEPPPPSLTGVPALIPRRFRGADAAGIRKFVEQAGSYREIFGTARPLIDRVDSLLTSSGPSRRVMGFIHEELRRAGSTPARTLTSARLSELVAGDIGGVVIPKPGLNAAGRKEVDELAAMWTGVKLAHLERIALQADRTGRPGMILVALGSDRSEIVAEAVRRGLVNELIIDRQLENALTRLLS